MTLEIGWLFGFFLFVTLTVCAAGYLYLRAAQHHGIAAGVTPPGWNLQQQPDSAQAALASVLRLAGRTIRQSASKIGFLRQRLFQAGYRTPEATEVFLGIRLVCAVGLAILTGWVVVLQKDSLMESVVPSFCAFGFGYFLPVRVLEALVAARRQRIRRALPGTLDLLVLAIEAGQPLDQAMLEAAASLRRVHPDLCSELLFCHLEMRAGTDRAQALRHLAERCSEQEVNKLVHVLLDGDRFGTSLGPALRTHARYLRIRMRQQAQEQARKLSVKLVLPVFFLIFPSILLVTLGPAVIQMQQFFADFLAGF